MALSEAELLLLIRAKNEASQTLKQVDKDVGGLGKTMADVGKIAGGFIVAQALTTGVQKLTGFFGDSITQGIKLGESLNAVNKIFGESAKTVLDWGKQNATSFGLSQQAFNQMATPLGAILRNAGFNMDEVTDKTIILTKRAADMASVFNTDVKTALEAIMSGLKGEANPLEQFGVGLSAAKVEAQAMAETGKKTAAALTDLEKQTARFNLILKETATSEGDFTDTIKEAANAARVQEAEMEELQATIGTKLIPVQLLLTQAKLAMVQVIADKVIPAFDAMVGFINATYVPAFKFLHDTVSGFVHVFQLGLEGGQMGGDLSLLTKIAFDLGQVFRNTLIPAFHDIREAFRLFVLILQGGEVGGEFSEIQTQAINLAATIRKMWVEDIKPALDEFMLLAADAADWINQHWDEIKVGIGLLAAGVELHIKSMIASTVLFVDGVALMAKLIKPTLDLIESWFSALKSVVNGVLDLIQKAKDAADSLPDLPSLPSLPAIPIPSFAHGGVMPYTGLAMLHAGERVEQAGVPSIVFNFYGHVLQAEKDIERIMRDSINNGGFPMLARA